MAAVAVSPLLGLDEVAGCLAPSDVPRLLAVDRELSRSPAYVRVCEDGQRRLRLRGCSFWGNADHALERVYGPTLRSLRLYGSIHQMRTLAEALERTGLPLQLRSLTLIGPSENRKVLADQLIWQLQRTLSSGPPTLHLLTATDLNLSRSGAAALGTLLANARSLRQADLHGLEVTRTGWCDFVRTLTSGRSTSSPRLRLVFQDFDDTFGLEEDDRRELGRCCDLLYRPRLGPFRDADAARRVLQTARCVRTTPRRPTAEATFRARLGGAVPRPLVASFAEADTLQQRH